MKTITWPAWFNGPNGQTGIFEAAEDVPKGWTSGAEKLTVDGKAPAAPKTESEPAIPPGTAAGVPAPAKPAAKKAGRPKKVKGAPPAEKPLDL